ncbi:hypothetical protein AGABI2DRAFT_120910 [Agaricus bisporus var. bisporus H97]|uniref:hypothetical protein n=1 Tax=Agaricus bisporus var. bisporus (strain H97 / ATCC MYA-4626 / FGSC 10389) TaxID=936046 RepID=UPI00029F6D7D|nr:hypothetical protein AGABI2DRAFT_120910 [Agaricus bisporus var. bisporus H97]EKV44812.1 hypothetical protein AGABI2DRAFT_120910 [Agaricus bisporus var. bisporus H97]
MPKGSLLIPRFLRFGRPRSPKPPPGPLYVQNTHEPKNVSVQGDGNYVNYNANSSNNFMAELLEKTIPGAAFDSSARDPPPRCHPGTRLAILARCLEFIANAVDEQKMRWVVGAAGVGKSAIMQNVADSCLPSESLGASIFFSINGRNEGTKAIVTLAFQLAAKCEPYRQFIEREIARNPSLFQSSLSVQFKKFITEPFIHDPLLHSIGRIMIIIDGLDECDQLHTQRELLQLISTHCSTYPSSPIVWMIASRPEPHITYFFAQDHVKAVYEKEEILVDSDEARNDVERFLRNELARIQKEFSLGSRSQWPPEQDLWKLADASGGLFVFADTVIKYIGDPVVGNPTSQLNDVLKFIDTLPLSNVLQELHPMARLDMLYAQILSKVPERTMVNTRKLLLSMVRDPSWEWSTESRNFLVLCNWLGMTYDDGYAAIRHLLSVLDAPPRDQAHLAELRSFHKSFIDYISDFTRSGVFSDIERKVHELKVQCTFRVLEQAPDGVDCGEIDYDLRRVAAGILRGCGAGNNISLTWPIDEKIDWNDSRTRLEMYKMAVSNVLAGISLGWSAFCTDFCIRLVITRLHSYDMIKFPFRELQNLVLASFFFHSSYSCDAECMLQEKSRRQKFLNQGILKRLPITSLNFSSNVDILQLQFRRPIAPAVNLSGRWKSSCTHERAGEWGGGKDENWTTKFAMVDLSSQCSSCCRRLERQLSDCITKSPNSLATVLFTSTVKSFIEFQFLDPDDGPSEWTYWLAYETTGEERRRLEEAAV